MVRFEEKNFPGDILGAYEKERSLGWKEERVYRRATDPGNRYAWKTNEGPKLKGTEMVERNRLKGGPSRRAREDLRGKNQRRNKN